MVPSAHVSLVPQDISISSVGFAELISVTTHRLIKVDSKCRSGKWGRIKNVMWKAQELKTSE